MQAVPKSVQAEREAFKARGPKTEHCPAEPDGNSWTQSVQLLSRAWNFSWGVGISRGWFCFKGHKQRSYCGWQRDGSSQRSPVLPPTSVTGRAPGCGIPRLPRRPSKHPPPPRAWEEPQQFCPEAERRFVKSFLAITSATNPKRGGGLL